MKFENGWVKIWHEGDVMYYKYKAGAEIDEILAKQLLKEIDKLFPYTRKSLIIIDNGFNFTDQALTYFANQNSQLITLFDKVAIVTHYHTITIKILNIFVSFSKSINFKVFNDFNKAKTWIEKSI